MCDVVSGLLKHPLDHALCLEGFHCDEQWAGWLAPYEKRSVLHLFIGFVAATALGRGHAVCGAVPAMPRHLFEATQPNLSRHIHLG